MKHVESQLHLIRASRQGEWEFHLGALEESVKYYFTHDLYKYSRLVPVYPAQMQLLKSTDRETWNALEGGDFMVRKSGIPFTNLFVDQTLEQLIREVKVAEGIMGITQNVDARDRFFLIAPELVKHMKEFLDAYCIDNDKSATKEHYQLSGSMAIRKFSNSGVIKKGIVKHCGCKRRRNSWFSCLVPRFCALLLFLLFVTWLNLFQRFNEKKAFFNLITVTV